MKRRAGLLALLLVAISACAAGEQPRERFTGLRIPVDPESIPPPDEWSGRAAYRGVEFADRLQADFDAFNDLFQPHETAGYGVPDFTSTYVNTSGGERRTHASARAGSTGVVSVWFVGGSAAFGYGQRDDATIASWMVRLAEQDGIALDVHNIAMNGWVFPQGARAVIQRLASGAPSPQLVVFYDGWNDVFASVQLAVARESLAVSEFALNADDSRIAKERVENDEAMSSIDAVGGIPALVEFTAARYRRFIGELEAALGPRGIEATYFFQPDSSTEAIQRDAVAGYRSVAPVQDLPVMADIVGATATALEDQGVANLRDVFAGTKEAVFIDPVHTNEAGARIVAAEAYRQLRPRLEALAGGTS